MTGVEELKGKWTEASVENFEKFMEKLGKKISANTYHKNNCKLSNS